MTCAEYRERVLDGAEAGPAEAAHRSACEECTAFYAALADADAQLAAALAGAAAPPGFDAALRRRLRAERSPSWLPEILDFLGWTGAAVLAGAMIWSFVPDAALTGPAALGAAAACMAGGAFYGLRAVHQRS